MDLPRNAWKQEPEALLRSLKSSEAGITDSEAQARAREFGANEIKKGGVSALRILISQFSSILVLVLFAAAIISYFSGDPASAAVITSLMLLNCLLGFVQEYKSHRAAEKLEKMISFSCTVKRGGEWREARVAELVPGDIVRIGIGDRVPADMRLLEANDLLIDEAVLTGESYPVKKAIAAQKAAAEPQDMRNMAFAGSMVSNGEGIGVVTASGEKTFFGETAALLEEPQGKSAFERNITAFSGILVKVIAASIAFIFAVNVLLGRGIIETVLFSVALAVGLVPEALPIIITLSLSRGASALSRHGVIVKRLSAIEDLGNVDVLCMDKTGTLTENSITVKGCVGPDGKPDHKVMAYAALCTEVARYDGKVTGNPIDVAIASHVCGPRHKRIQLIPFDYERRRMSVVANVGGELLLICKGSPEAVIPVSTARDKKSLSATFRGFGEQGYRAIAVAYKRIGAKKSYGKEDEMGLEFLGFVTFFDPPKKAVKDSLSTAKRLGVGIRLISGDNPAIARSVARHVGFEFSDDQVITGEDLANAEGDQKKLGALVERSVIFARLSPVQKHLVIKTLKRNGHSVAFLGDGVNDAPSLKEADVGISVNNGADVTKAAADIILLKKSINSVVQGISGGRKVFSNIIKYIMHTMGGNFGNMYTICLASVFLSFLPVLPVQMILSNFTSDGPALAISTDNVDDEELLMPKKWNVEDIARYAALLGLVSAIFTLVVMLYLIKETQSVFQTGVYLVFTVSGIIMIVSVRSSRLFFMAEPPSAWLALATILSLAAGIGLIYYRPLAGLFEFVQLPLDKLGFLLALMVAYIACMEIAKLAYGKKFKKDVPVDERALATLRKKIVPELH